MSGEDTVEFNLPAAIGNFLFDLHDSVRRSRLSEEVQKLYEVKLKEITDKYFAQSTWPEAKVIAADVYNDEFFLALYSEMTTRHITTKLKPQLSHHIASWANYKKLFDLVAAAKSEDFYITTQWVYDIMQEFAYQFQGFCQYRGLAHSAEVTKQLQAHRDAWTLPEVMALLDKLIAAGALDQAQGPLVVNQAPVLQQFAYFATIEKARLLCLLGDHAASLATIASLRLDRADAQLFSALPICHFNVHYHVGVSNMMLQRFHDALDAFSEAVLFVLRILKPGAGATLRPGVPAALQRMLDKALTLAAILLVVTPSYPAEDALREAAEAKLGDKMRRLREGDREVASEMFEAACPKFISAVVPDYAAPAAAAGSAVFAQQSAAIVAEVLQHVPFLKLRSFLSMYASVDLSKLARFMDLSEADLSALLQSFQTKMQQQITSNGKNNRAGNDFRFHVAQGVLVVDAAPAKVDDLAHERFFIAGVKKHQEIIAHVNKTFAQLNL